MDLNEKQVSFLKSRHVEGIQAHIIRSYSEFQPIYNAADVDNDTGLANNELLIEGTIDSDSFVSKFLNIPQVSAKDVRERLGKMDLSGNVYLIINSSGGDLFEARAIVDAIKSKVSGKVIPRVVGKAFSAGGLIAMSFSKPIEVADGAAIMCHRCQSVAFGDANEKRKVADIQDKFDESIAATLSNFMGKTRDESMKILDDVTWYSDTDFLNSGWATKAVYKKPSKDVTDEEINRLRAQNREYYLNMLDTETHSIREGLRNGYAGQLS